MATIVSRLPESARHRLESLMEAAVPVVAPAMVLVVVREGELVYEGAFGWLDPEEHQLPVTPETRFDLASVSKLFTATAFLTLVTEGRIALDEPIVRLIPEFGAISPRGLDGGQNPFTRDMNPVPVERAGWRVWPSAVTWRQLLTHSSGLAPWRSVFDQTGPIPPPPGQLDPVAGQDRWHAGVNAICGYSFHDRPGRAVHYSDLGFMLLGEGVRRLDQRPYEESVAQRVTHPLGLASAAYSPLRNGVPRDRIAPTSIDQLWRLRRSWGEVEDENAAGLGGCAGHAGLFATARDVAAFGLAWLSRDARLLIQPSLMDEAVSEQVEDGDERRGLGWALRERRPRADGSVQTMESFSSQSYGHTGFTGTSLSIDPSCGVVVALLSNRVYAGRSHDLLHEFRPEIHTAIMAVTD